MLLIAGANMMDPNFSRTITLLCDHRREGSFGLVLNQRLNLKLSDIVPSIKNWDATLYRGGPVQNDTLHFIHRCEKLDISSQEIAQNIFWGGDFIKLNEILAKKKHSLANFRFFLGYTGWGEGQLMNEIKEESWYLRSAKEKLVFFNDTTNHWRSIFKTMGPDYKILSMFPDDPRLN